MLTKKTSKNQITLPKNIVKNFPDALYFDVSIDNDQILLRPVKVLPSTSTLDKARGKLKKLGVTEKDIKEAIVWARRSSG